MTAAIKIIKQGRNMENYKKDFYQKSRELTYYLINEDICARCGVCQKACPHGAIIGEKKKFYRITDTQCQKCGTCKEVCEFDAINVSYEEIRQRRNMENYKKDFYQKLRNDISNWANSKKGKNYRWTKYLMVAPDIFHLSYKLMLDKDVPIEEKIKLTLAIAYFIAPLDLVPEVVMGPIAYIDDVALAAYVLNSLLNNIDIQIVTRHWAGDEDILKTIRQILVNAERMIKSGLWKRIKKIFD